MYDSEGRAGRWPIRHNMEIDGDFKSLCSIRESKSPLPPFRKGGEDEKYYVCDTVSFAGVMCIGFSALMW